MKRMKIFLSCLILCAAMALAGCGDSGSTDTVWIQASGAKLSGRVTDGDGTPISGAAVALFSGGVNVHAALSDGEGHYVMYGLQPGVYALEAELEGYWPYCVETLEVSGAAVHDIVLEMTAVSSVTGVVATDMEGDELPVEEARVSLWADGEEVAWTLSDGEGRYLLEEVPPGGYTLRAQAGYYRDYEKEIALSREPLTENILLEALYPPGPVDVRGRIVYPSGGVLLPATSATVFICDSQGVHLGGFTPVVSDPSGFFFFSSVPRGLYLFEVFFYDESDTKQFNGHIGPYTVNPPSPSPTAVLPAATATPSPRPEP